MSDAGAVLLAGCGDAGCRAGLLLAAAGRRVYGLRRSEAALPAPLLPLRADLTDAASLRNLPDDIRDVIFLPAPGRRDEAAYRGLFLDGLANLLDALQRRGAGLRRLLFVSSSAVYGEHGGAWVDEDSECRPLAFNGRLLLEAERRLAGAGVSAVVARCSGIYGPGRTRLIDQVVNGQARRPAGAPEFSNRIHVDDVAGALAHLVGLAEVQSCYVLSDDEPVPLDQVQSWLARQLRLPPLPPGAASGERAVGSKRLCNRRLRASGYELRHADFRSGYAPLLAGR
ncbi:NAD-dependent epimerase/dehydratase family protein [Tahibacter harae]|uniref:NAD-dependent epimerase/dehydratase family protein n=1 Tax=Tahibacter harae TaxID=2963937 RepID=A0ABT1QSI7_9GAMM|nr:NAD-dependent epimerase/dehydratase family protein [Tahibacter harae]